MLREYRTGSYTEVMELTQVGGMLTQVEREGSESLQTAYEHA